MGTITAVEAAVILGVDPSRVRQLIAEGQLKAHKVGRDWLLSEAAVRRFKPRPVGRPKNEYSGGTE